MNKRKLFVVLSALCISSVLLAAGCAYVRSVTAKKTYSSAKEACVKILSKEQADMETVATEALDSKENGSGQYKEYAYSCRQENGTVTFEIDAQGMLGGQYWQLIYTEDGTYCGETETYRKEETAGNNIIRAEKLDGHWWYCWIDFDGTERSEQ